VSKQVRHAGKLSASSLAEAQTLLPVHQDAPQEPTVLPKDWAILKEQTALMLGALQTLYIVHMIASDWMQDTFDVSKSNLAAWGTMQAPAFLFLSGFVAWLEMGSYSTPSTFSVVGQWLARFYPVFVLSVLFLPMVGATAWSLDQVWMLLLLPGWDPTLMALGVNPAVWLMATLLLGWCLAPTVYSMVCGGDLSTKAVVLFFATASIAAAPLYLVGSETWLFDPSGSNFRAQVQYSAAVHMPQFVAGMLFAAILAEHRQELHLESCIAKVLTRLTCFTLALVPFVLMFSTTLLPKYTNEYAGVLYTAMCSGLLLPCTAAALLLCLPLEREGDIEAEANKPICFEGVCTAVGSILQEYSLCLYILSGVLLEPTGSAGAKYLELPYESHWIFLIVVSLTVQQVFAKPIEALLLRIGDAVTNTGGRTQLNISSLVPFTFYYLSMAVFVAVFWMRSASKESWFGLVSVTDIPWLDWPVTAMKWMIMLCLPNLILNTIGHLFWPVTWPMEDPESLDDMINSGRMKNHRIHFRIVTRGLNPELVKDNAEELCRTLEKCGGEAFRKYWVVEVSTDNPLQLSERTKEPVVELLTPHEYRTSTGAKFKARALQWAIENSSARDLDWVVHLDEETAPQPDVIKNIFKHCMEQNEKCERGEQQYGDIGQGSILYGCGEVENYLTTLADSLRVADDLGKFRFQFAMRECWVGMHGSFVVCQTQVEKVVTFDHGIEGSITEDAYFALVARHLGVRYAWVDGEMHEQSPFSVNDFMMQRKRWFGGLVLVCKAPLIDIRHRLTLAIMTFAWALQPFACLAMVLSWTVSSDVSDLWRYSSNVVAALWYWSYFLGFWMTFRISDGIGRYFLLLGMQLALVPVFAFFELGGVLHGLQYDPTDGFFIVKKEKNGANSEVLEAKKRDESEDGAGSQATSETSLNIDCNQQLQEESLEKTEIKEEEEEAEESLEKTEIKEEEEEAASLNVEGKTDAADTFQKNQSGPDDSSHVVSAEVLDGVKIGGEILP